MIDFLDSHTGFFEENVHYVIREYDQSNPYNQDRSNYTMKYDESGNLMFINSYISLFPDDRNVRHDITINKDLLMMEEMIEDSSLDHCNVNYYTLDSGTLSSDGKEVTFNMNLDAGNHSKGFNTISIRRI